MVPARACLPAAVAILLQRQPLSPAKVTFVWCAAVGPAISRATTVSLAHDGTLEVRTSSRGWRDELVRSQAVILPRLRMILGEDVVKKIWIA